VFDEHGRELRLRSVKRQSTADLFQALPAVLPPTADTPFFAELNPKGTSDRMSLLAGPKGIDWIMRRMALLLIAALVLARSAGPAALAQEAGKDCAGFASQAESV
jgi:hypothetical protein